MTEALDPTSTQHLLPGASEPAYLTDPPTSGAHSLAPEVVGVLPMPLDRPAQVGLLEKGFVLLQHRDLDPAGQGDLEALAGDRVVVAPNSALAAPVVATAWRHKLACSAVDTVGLRAFVDAHRGRGPDS